MDCRFQMMGIALALATALGCGGPPYPPTHQDFSTMQILEARTFDAASIATDEDRPCAEREPAVERCDRAQESLCLVSEDLDDSDAAQWCAAAVRRCREARASWQVRCTESAPGAPG